MIPFNIRNKRTSREIRRYFGTGSGGAMVPNYGSGAIPNRGIGGAVAGAAGGVAAQVAGQLLKGEPIDVPRAIGDNLGYGAGNMTEKILNQTKAMGKQVARKTKSGRSKSGSSKDRTGTGNPASSGGSGGFGGGGDRTDYYYGSVSSSSPGPFSPPQEGGKVTLSSAMDRQYIKNPLVVQDITDAHNNARVTINVLNFDKLLDFSDNQTMSAAWFRIYSEYKQSINNETNGGTAASFNNFTYENFTLYFTRLFRAIAWLAEVDAVMTWNASFAETNLIVRRIMSEAANNITLYQVRNNIAAIVSKMACPPQVVDYYKWLFQPYKMSPVSAGNITLNRSNHFTYDLYKQLNDFDSTITAGRSIYTDLTDIGVFDTNAVISALLLTKVKFNCNLIPSPIAGIGEPVYDNCMNAILDNFPVSDFDETNQNTSQTYGFLSEDESMTAAFPMDADNVPLYVSAHLMTNWASADVAVGLHNNGFPMFNLPYNSLSIPVNGLGQSRLILADFSGSPDFPYDFIPMPMQGPGMDISNHIVQYESTISPVNTILKPKGLNTYTFAPSYEACNIAGVDFLYGMFGVPPLY